MAVSLHDHLLDLKAEMLKLLAHKLGITNPGGTRKEHLALAIIQAMTSNLPEVVAALTEAERLYLAECVDRGELISGREFQAKYSLPCPQTTRHYHYGMKDAALLTLFIHVPRFRGDQDYGLVGGVAGSLRDLLPKPAAVQARAESHLPATYHFKHRWRDQEDDRPIQVHESERIAPVELSRVLRLIQGGKIKVTDAGRRPTDASCRLLAEALVVPDFALDPPAAERDQGTELAGPVRAHAWGVLVQQCGWAKCRAGVLNLTGPGQSFLQGFNPEQYRLGVGQFFLKDDFDELNRINHIRGQSGKGKRWMTDPGMRKMAVQAAMEKFPVGQWLEFKEARRLVDASGELWNVLTGDRSGLYFGELQYGFIPHTSGLNSQFLRALFLESLAPLGVVDVAYVYPHHLWPEFGDAWGVDDLSFCGRYDGLLYVRLNPLGAFALELTDAYEAQATAAPTLFRVHPNLELELATDRLDLVDQAMLELLAAPAGDRAWTLDAGRILSHVESGGTIAALLNFLETRATEELPTDVRDYLESLEARRQGCRRVRPAVLVEWANEALARRIATGAGTAKLCAYAGGNRVVVAKSDFRAFASAAKALGYVLPGVKD